MAIIAYYAHRLPANYDTGIIRTRAKERGVLWDAVPELYFKAFLLRESGQHGAIANSYSSLYLWRQDTALRDFLVTGRYKTVTDSFGRAEIQTRFVLDARKGRATEARFAYMEELDIPLDTALTAASASEIERNKEMAGQEGTVAAATSIDTLNWKFTRILLATNEQGRTDRGVACEILHLARPLLNTLPEGEPR
jgi:hypothetical protein